VLTAEGGTLTGTVGASIEQQVPVTGVRLTDNEIRFRMEAAGGLDFNPTFAVEPSIERPFGY